MAAAAYTLVQGNTFYGRLKEQYLFTTNTLASAITVDFLNADYQRINVGDWVKAQKVDDLTKVPLGTAAVTDAALYVVVTSSSTHVDLAIVAAAGFTNAS